MRASTNKKYKAPVLERRPVVRLRHVVMLVAAVTAVLAGPLFMVWKQVYVRNAAIRKEQLADSLSVLSSELGRLKFTAEKLGATPRIETIARERLGLDYPASSRIVIVTPRQARQAAVSSPWQFLAVLRRSILQDRGS